MENNLIETILQGNIVDNWLPILHDLKRAPIAIKYTMRGKINKIGMWGLVDSILAKELAKYIKNPCLEIMAGSGYLANALRAEGVIIDPTDINPSNPVINIKTIAAIEAVKKYASFYNTLLISWAPYKDNTAYQAIKLYFKLNTKGRVVYIGEGEGGCCADCQLFESFKFDLIITPPQWEGIHDYVYEVSTL